MTQPLQKNRVHLLFLDGIRGLAAVYVLFFHILSGGDEVLSADNFLLNLFRFGHEAVVVFIVLSGVVLTLPLVKSNQLKIEDGEVGFIKRRARRILPAYYAGLLLLPVFFLLIELLKQVSGEGSNWIRIKELFMSPDMLSHLLLLQNLSRSWAYSTNLNIVLWSMSTEWWIYFIFALLLLPIWRRFGLVAALWASLLIGLLPTGLHLLGLPLLSGFPHLLGVFGLGMACAAILSFQWYTDNFRLWRIILVILGSVALIAFGFIAIFAPQIRYDPLTRWITDLLIAMACAAFILDLVTSKQQIGSSSSQKHPVLSFLELRPVLFLGAISYSLYLTHVVVWAMLGIFLGLAPVRRFISLSTDPFPIRLFVVIPLLILFAYLFYLVFEKPFLSSRKR